VAPLAPVAPKAPMAPVAPVEELDLKHQKKKQRGPIRGPLHKAGKVLKSAFQGGGN
jgi:hypothetical protein